MAAAWQGQRMDYQASVIDYSDTMLEKVTRRMSPSNFPLSYINTNKYN